MKKSSAASCRSRSGTFPSPGTPIYRHGVGSVAYQNGWSSERVPLPTHCNRRYGGSGVLLPFANGRALPSKWEDAERWIFSPVSGDGVGSSSVPPSHHRRPKSKSGPLGAPAGKAGAYSSASPLVPCFDSGRVRNYAANSPFLAGVLMPERSFCGNGGGVRGGDGGSSGGGTKGVCGTGGGSMGGKSHAGNGEPYVVRSASIHGWSDTLIESSSSMPSSQDEKSEGTRESASTVSAAVLRKDVATQMSPGGSIPSSPKGRPFSPSLSSVPPLEELENHFSKSVVRDVQVDDQVTVTRWSKKHTARSSDRRLASILEWKKKKTEASNSSGWEVAETEKPTSKYKREEAKITAWENLQKAKAEAEIRKLEMKLEKKRSSSMEKILNKLRSAQKKAQEMRSAVTPSQDNQLGKTTRKASYFCRSGQISSLIGCFTCAF
ncbi:remorin C-terminal domain containing protein [Musa troglodytarum]|uniref:Remorin C-terminal domain containing protein n=1 Tax=Musa troglodytarum TaxID=320322 RepID=A0A9E7HUK0_9LILI|nr:remorin C-terminal domain containing protein [Musa troglodytarum]URE40199.1 remorin C-terminal domain containing protein [Musa troglodytarum]URE40200.1 remorin C-terminal domain containing protein [Musa troglodytarum]URE40201.1 remorin C-terminal domain containing protein [Musa troglodytarum]URE40202.1 remorin C-terminal domain containing protein [Musa troglodytarum]